MLKGILWTLLDRFSNIILQFITLMVLGRLLSPSDFAIVGIAMFFISISQIIIDSGMGGNLLQKEDLDSKDLSTLFIYNVGVSLILFFLIFSFTPFISDFYDNQDLLLVIPVVNLSIIISAFGKIHNIILFKELKFKEISRISIVSSAISSFIGIIMAYCSWGYWALVFQNLFYYFIILLLQFYYSRFIPKLIFSKESFFEQWEYGRGLLFSKSINTIYNNILLVIFPKITSLTFSGYYSQANRIYNIPINISNSVIQGVLFPFFSKEKDMELLLLKFRDSSRVFYLISFSLFIFLAIFSKEIVVFLLGEKWENISLILSVLSLLGIINVITLLLKNILKLKGKTKDIFYFDLLNCVMGILAIVITYKWENKIYLIVGMVITSFITLIIFLSRVEKIIEIRKYSLFKDIFVSIVPLIIPSLFLLYQPYNNVSIYYLFFLFIIYILMIIGCGILISNSEIKLLIRKIKK